MSTQFFPRKTIGADEHYDFTPKFTYELLTKTSHDVDNTPNADELANLKWLATFLEEVYSTVGPFEVVSGFRTKQLQELLRSEGEPTAARKSFHEAGMAVDVYPTNMSLEEFYWLLVSSFYGRIGEPSIKAAQNAVHFALPTPSNISKIMALNSETGVYEKIDEATIQQKITQYASKLYDNAAEIASTISLEVNKPAIRWGILAAVVGIASAAYFFLMGKKRVA